MLQKAWRKGRKRDVGRVRRRAARELERRCWGRGRSVWKTPVGLYEFDVAGLREERR